MSESKVRGTVHVIEETKSYGQKGFRKRLVVLEQQQARFVNYIPLDFVGDACDAANDLNVSDEIEVEYRLAGRKWQRDAASEVKYFLNAEAMSFRILRRGEADAAAAFTSLDPESPAADDNVPF